MLRELIFVLLVLMFFYYPFAEAKSISQSGLYVDYCLRAGNDDEEFKNFKRNPIYRTILEHATFKQGKEYLDFIQERNPNFLNQAGLLRKNDSVGNPVTYDYPVVGKFSPATLQYLKIANDLKEHFGDLSQFRIVEIGGGYGGQCLVISQLSKFKHYTLIDLPQCLPLAEKYLRTQNVPNVSFLGNHQLDQVPPADLLISNFAFSEIDIDEQTKYLQQVIQRIPRGYMTVNFISKLFNVNSMTEKKLVETLEKAGAKVTVMPEIPPTGDNNVIVTWKPKEK